MEVLGNTDVLSLLVLIYLFLISRNESSTWKVSKYTFLIHSTDSQSQSGENVILLIFQWMPEDLIFPVEADDDDDDCQDWESTKPNFAVSV